MIFYAGIPLHIPGPETASYIAARIPIADVFGFFRPKYLGLPSLDPRSLFNWFLSRPLRINSLYWPWGASRFGFSLVLADGDMLAAITAQNSSGNSLPFQIDDDVGNSIGTDLFQLPAVPLAKILTTPQLPLWLLPLVDQRQRWWETAAPVTVTEQVTTWTDLYTQIGAALGVTIAVDPISPAYLFPSALFATQQQHLPLLLDLCAASIGHRIVCNLDGSVHSYNATTAASLQLAQARIPRKLAGGSLDLGVLSA